jgi:hypothetical protein
MKKALLIICAFSMIAFYSCKKNHILAKGDVTLEMDNVVDGIHIDVTGATQYTDALGDTFTVSKLKYYITNVQLKKKDGTWYSDPNSYYLINEADSNARTCVLADVPGEEYTSVRFTVGVDSAKSVAGPQTGALDPANGMIMTSGNGYIFFNAEGHSPSVTIPTHSFIYHIGGYTAMMGGAAMRTIEKDFGGATLTVDGTREAEIHMTAEFKTFLGNVNMSLNHEVTTPGNAAMEFAGKYANMFTFEHIHNGN